MDQWWLPIKTLYGVGGRTSALLKKNSSAISRAFWHLCKQAGFVSDPEIGESFLLASTVSKMRTVGSNRIFADSIQLDASRRSPQLERPIEELLGQGSLKPLTPDEFQRHTWGMLGRSEFPPEARDERQKLTDQLFPPALALLRENESEAIRLFQREWEIWRKGPGRHRGKDNVKLAMDLLSYEARAAFHRAYSAVWFYLIIPQLADEFGWTLETREFHEFWHTDPAWETKPAEAPNFHLFHGHIFGLHPAGGIFLKTESGRQLVGNWLACRRRSEAMAGLDSRLWSGLPGTPGVDRESPEEVACFGLVLGGLLAAVYQYSESRDQIKQHRRDKYYSSK